MDHRNGHAAERRRLEERLSGLRILVVEDEALAALQIEDLLESFGCTVIGPAARVGHALDLLDAEDMDFAILDLNVAGELVYPVAEALREKGLPFIFATGMGIASLDEAFRNRPVLQKPYAAADLRRTIAESFAEAG